MGNIKILEETEKEMLFVIERDLSFKEAFKIFRDRKIKEIVIVEKECTQLNMPKQ